MTQKERRDQSIVTLEKIVNDCAAYECEKVIKELQEELAKYQWQPIERAPKDVGFLAFQYGYGIHITHWSQEHDGGRGGYRNTHHGWSPTHFMPLPTPPKQQGE